MIKVYGIINCTTVQKTRKWLESHNVEYQFHDYKKLGIDRDTLQRWCQEFGWQKILNRSGMMWRKTLESEKVKVIDATSAINFIMKTPTSIKRPILEYHGGVLLGFEESEYAKTLIG